MGMQTEAESKLAELIVSALDLEDIGAEEISPEDPLFGSGLGLDSIDALEIVLAVAQEYGVQIKADDESNHAIFSSLRSLSTFINAQS